MTIVLNVRSDLAKVRDQLSLKKEEINKAATRALNKTAQYARSFATKEISKAIGIKQSSVRDKLQIIKATREHLEARVQGTGKVIPLIQFKARQTSEGVVVTIGGTRRLYRGHFIATMPNGHVGVFFRKGGRRVKKMGHTGRTYLSELPIVERYGPSIPVMLTSKAISVATRAAIKERWPVLFAHELRFILHS